MSLMNQKEINTLLKNISKKGKEFDEMVQEACIQAIGHSVAHGNVMPAITIANDLLAAMNEGSRKQAIVSFLESFGKLRYHPKTKTSNAMFKFYDKGNAAAPLSCEKVWTDEYETMLRMVKWYSFSRETIKSIHTIMGDVEQFLKSMSNRFKVTDGKEAPKDHELLSFLQEAVKDYKELRAAAQMQAIEEMTKLQAAA